MSIVLSSTSLLPLSTGVGIVMRYEGGGSLSQLLHPKSSLMRQPLSLAEKLRIAKAIAEGLAELHAAGIVHGRTTSH